MQNYEPTTTPASSDMNASCILTRRPMNVLLLDIQPGCWAFAAEYTDCMWNGGWFTFAISAQPLPPKYNADLF